jgi:hypothetical protein
MQINTHIAVALAPVVNSVAFGAGVVPILSIPSLAAQATYYLAAWALFATCLTPPFAQLIAPRLRSRAYREGRRDP